MFPSSLTLTNLCNILAAVIGPALTPKSNNSSAKVCEEISSFI